MHEPGINYIIHNKLMQLQYVINIFTTSKFITIVSTVVVVVTAQGTTDAVSVVGFSFALNNLLPEVNI